MNENDAGLAPNTSDVPDQGTEKSGPKKTPLYKAEHSARYQRQTLIKEIEAATKSSLICYVAGVRAAIDRDDILGFMELLHNVPVGCDVDLLLNTPGGDIDAAEKIMSVLHSTVGLRRLRVIVPDYAKSAGTIMALGANAIVMGVTSELGPIDPRFQVREENGNVRSHSVLHYLKAYELLWNSLANAPRDVPSTVMLSRLHPATKELMESQKSRARTIAEQQLHRWMFNEKGGAYTEIVSKLMNIELFPSHNQMISAEDASQMGLVVEQLSVIDPLWVKLWELYCLQRMVVSDCGKLFESAYASHITESEKRPVGSSTFSE